MEQKKTTAQKMIAELQNYLAHQLFSMALSRLAFFFMAMGIFLILVGLAGANWRIVKCWQCKTNFPSKQK